MTDKIDMAAGNMGVPGAAFDSRDVAPRVIAEMPLPEQDNMLSANMRRVAVQALAAVNSQLQLKPMEARPFDRARPITYQRSV